MDKKFADSVYANSIGLLIHSSLVQDRAAVIDYLSRHGKVKAEPKIHHDVNHQTLRIIIEELGNRSFVMALSPKTSPSLNLTSFNGYDVVKIIKEIEVEFTVMIWTMIYRY